MSPEQAPERKRDSETESKTESPKDSERDSDRPPILRTWRQMYLLVLLTLLGVVLLFSALTWIYG
ncbi:MAG: hypothetical protein U1A78_32945 [Polyangia bacterium]